MTFDEVLRRLELEHDEDLKMLRRFGIRRTSDLMALEPDDVQEMVGVDPLPPLELP